MAINMFRAHRILKCLLIAVLLAALAVPALGQLLDPYVVIRNRYIEAKLGNRDPSNVQLVPGRVSFGTIEGDPETPGDNNKDLTWNHSNMPNDVWCWTTLNIADTGSVGIFGDKAFGRWSLEPMVGPLGDYMRCQYTTNASNIVVDLKMDLCRDMCRMNFTITNKDTVTHQVGLRMGWDEGYEVAGGTVDALPYVPGYGTIPLGEYEFLGVNVPEYVDHLDSVSNPVLVSRQIFRDPETTGIKDRHITPPDRVVVGEFIYMRVTSWPYDIVPDRTPTDLYTYAWWNPTPLAPNQSRKIVMYVGVGVANEDLRSPYVLATQAPRAVGYDTTSSTGLFPETFAIKGYVSNLYPDVDISNCSLFLTLPQGLELVAGETAKKTISLVKALQEGAVAWQVRPTGEYAGNLTYYITATGAGMISKTVARSVAVPCTRSALIYPEWQMFTVPFQLSDPSPAASLQVPSGALDVLYYDPDVGDYVSVDSLQPGKGVWIKATASSTQKLTVSGATAMDGKATYQIPLLPGWNMFGNPFIYSVLWDRVKVLNERSGTTPVTVADAVARGWIKPTIYWWDVPSHSYDRASGAAATLEPWMGYWVKALAPCKLIIPVLDQIGSQISSVTNTSLTTRSADSASGDGWKVQIVAKAGDAASGKAIAGVTSRASDGYGSDDIETPPLMRDYVSVSFPHNDWGVNSGRYVEEFKKADGLAKTWDMEVSTDKLNTDVVLTWPDLSRVPKDYGLKLVDVDGNVTRYMRTTSSYRYNTGNSTVRRFKLVADTNKSGRLRISGLTVMPTRSSRGATISYTLSSDAVAQVRVMKAAGQTVRNLPATGSVSRGIASQSWDYRDNSGNDVAPGAYLVEVRATTPEGETAKMVTTLVIPR